MIIFNFQFHTKKPYPRSLRSGIRLIALPVDHQFYIFLGYRNIDSILYKEKAIQEKLQRALDETRLSNEIISSIAKTYQYISRIDIEADWFEEVSNRDRVHMKFLKGGCVSQGNKKICKDVVAEEYLEAFLKFTDLSTLPERMKKEETIAIEYRTKFYRA